MAGEQEACHRQQQTEPPAQQQRATQAPGQPEAEQAEPDRHGQFDHPACNAIGDVARRGHFAGHEGPAGLGQHAAQHGGTGLGKAPCGGAQQRILRRRKAGAE